MTVAPSSARVEQMSLAENESDESEKTAQRDRRCSDVLGFASSRARLLSV